MQIKVLGSGCSNCATLEERTKVALAELGVEADVAKVEDMAAIVGYGVMSTPGLVIDEKLVSSGRVPEVAELKEIIMDFGSSASADAGKGGCGCDCAEGCC